ncbi:MAG: glycosyltransferase family 4 protein [Armatimonadetes bacterium]|nr:glycosyltransferase family 4 protein [Armatimonadota bacterium]
MDAFEPMLGDSSSRPRGEGPTAGPAKPVPWETAAMPEAALRVLMLTPSYLPRSGGVERHVRCVSRELLARGVEVRVATPRWDAAWPVQESAEGVEVIRLSRSRAAGMRELTPHVDWAEVVHTHDAYPFLKYYLPHRLRRPRRPVFATFHGYEGYPIPLEAKALRRIVLWLTWGSLCAGAFIPKWYRFRCAHVTHGGVDAPEARPPLGDGAVFVGRLEPDTGFLGYVEALGRLKEAHGIDLPLGVCGDGSLREAGETAARERGLNVTFHGRVPDATPYLSRARFACVSGLLAMLEAMAAGAIVLALYDNPLKEDYLRLFPGAGHLVIAGSPGELADRAAELVGHPELQEAIAAEAFEFARAQTWGKVADLYLQLWAAGGVRQP